MVEGRVAEEGKGCPGCILCFVTGLLWEIYFLFRHLSEILGSTDNLFGGSSHSVSCKSLRCPL